MNRNATSEQMVVIVGAGIAGGNAAVTLREEGWRGRIVLLGAEHGIPFGRPPLSKTYLRGEEDLAVRTLAALLEDRQHAPTFTTPGAVR